MNDNNDVVHKEDVPRKVKDVTAQKQRQLKQRLVELEQELDETTVQTGAAKDIKTEIKGVKLGLQAITEVRQAIRSTESGRPD